MSRRLNLSVIGLGQCGGNVANTFAKHGYKAMAFNTSQLDLKDLSEIPEQKRVHIPLKKSDGAGNDPSMGAEAIRFNKDKILKAAGPLVRESEGVVIAAGLGGGTGSNAAILAGMLRGFDVPILTLVTIPTNNEPVVCKINALLSINQLVKENFDSCILVDNEKILSRFPDGNLAGFYEEANESVVTTFDSFNSLDSEMNGKCLISFDNEDFRRVLLSRGLLILGEQIIPSGKIHSLEEILPQLQTIWEESGLMPQGFDFNTAAIGSVSIFSPPSLLERTSSKFLKMLGEEFKKVTNGATSYLGLYELDESAPLRITTMLGRLAIPHRLQEMLASATTEGENLSRKINQELPQLDISGLEGIQLHGSQYSQSGKPAGGGLESLSQSLSSFNKPSQAKSEDSQNQDVYVKSQPEAQAKEADHKKKVSEEDKDSDLKDFQTYSLEEYVKLKKQKEK